MVAGFGLDFFRTDVVREIAGKFTDEVQMINMWRDRQSLTECPKELSMPLSNAIRRLKRPFGKFPLEYLCLPW